MNTYHDHVVQANQRQTHLLREAETERLLQSNAGASSEPNAADRLLATLGDWMVSQGERLKARIPSPEYRVLRTE
ncbi:MAG: hypothetical protein J0L63_20185 [Anaerolineae bacterium]|nr:hypothetical protein [Anaerolineae bacterium]